MGKRGLSVPFTTTAKPVRQHSCGQHRKAAQEGSKHHLYFKHNIPTSALITICLLSFDLLPFLKLPYHLLKQPFYHTIAKEISKFLTAEGTK